MASPGSDQRLGTSISMAQFIVGILVMGGGAAMATGAMNTRVGELERQMRQSETSNTKLVEQVNELKISISRVETKLDLLIEKKDTQR